MALTESIQWDVHGRLASDLRCVSCGHNLRGLARGGECGECGVPVKWTLEGSYLHAHDPAWVERLRSGGACLALTLPWLWLPPAWIVYAVGLWRVTAPDPASPRGGSLLRFSVVRLLFAATLPVIACGVIPACALYWRTIAGLPRFDADLVTLIMVVACVLLVPLFTGAAIRRVVLWEGSKRLRRHHRSSLWLTGLALVFVAGWAVNEIAALRMDILVTGAVIAFPLGVWGFGLFASCLARAWRTLDRAEVHARALRTQTRYWQRPVPGGSATTDFRVSS